MRIVSSALQQERVYQLQLLLPVLAAGAARSALAAAAQTAMPWTVTSTCKPSLSHFVMAVPSVALSQ